VPGSGQGAWGWHPLDNRWAQRVVDAARVVPGELVLDVGAGLGALTAPLVRAGAQVVAVELHPGRAEKLRRRFADEPVTVVRADAADLRLPSRPFRVVSSPPYGISTALLKRLLAPGSRFSPHPHMSTRPFSSSAARTASAERRRALPALNGSQLSTGASSQRKPGPFCIRRFSRARSSTKRRRSLGGRPVRRGCPAR
jgi:SAM-dependent methyltransferase